MNIYTEVTGVSDVVGWIQDLPDKIRTECLTSMENIVADVVGYVVSDKLSGQVLARRSGRLQASIYGSAAIQGDLVVGEIGSKGVPYAAIQEYGGQTSPHEIFPTAARALSFIWGGDRVFFAHVNHPGSKMPENSYLRSAILDMHEVILEEFRDGVLRAIQS